MNKARRKILKDGVFYINKAMEIVENVKDEEQESLDSLPDGLVGSSRATEMEGYIDSLDEAYNSLEEVISIIDDIAN